MYNAIMPRRSFKDYFKPRPASGVSSICPCPRCFAERLRMQASTSSAKSRDPPPYSPPAPADTICSCADCLQTGNQQSQSPDECEICKAMYSQAWEALPAYVDDRKSTKAAAQR